MAGWALVEGSWLHAAWVLPGGQWWEYQPTIDKSGRVAPPVIFTGKDSKIEKR